MILDEARLAERQRMRMPLSGLMLTALCVLPFTQLRLGFGGLGEALTFFVFVVMLVNTGFKPNFARAVKPIVVFQCFFVLIMTISGVINLVMGVDNPGYLGEAAFNLAAYFFTMITVIVLSSSRTYQAIDANKFFRMLYNWWAAIFLALFTLSFFMTSIAGFQLRWFGRFLPLVENQHQVALMFCTLPFIGIMLVGEAASRRAKSWYLFSAAMFAIMADQTGSDKARMSLALGASAGAVFFLLSGARGRNRAVDPGSAFIGMALTVLLVGVFSDRILQTAVSAFQEMDYQNARYSIWTSALQNFLEHPFLGGGPGEIVRVGFTYIDAHSSVLTAATQGGILALGAVVVLLGFLLRLALLSPMTAAAVSSLFPYFLGGDVFRRTNYWVLVVAVIAIHRTASAPSISSNSEGRQV